MRSVIVVNIVAVASGGVILLLGAGGTPATNDQLWRIPDIGIGQSVSVPYFIMGPGDVLTIFSEAGVGRAAMTGFGSLLVGTPI